MSIPRTVSWFSCGAASAVATKLAKPDVIAYCVTGSEDEDNERFLLECQQWFGQEIVRLRGAYTSTWEVWEDRRYIAGPYGAPCTRLLKVVPRMAFQLPDDVHIFGYTNDRTDVLRAQALRENWPKLRIHTPLITEGITKAGCLALIQKAGIKPPRVYGMGFPNANCIPCCKATSPAYWALVRKEFPLQFQRMVELSRKLGVRLTTIKGERKFIDQIPRNQPVTAPIAPDCDFLCGLVEQELGIEHNSKLLLEKQNEDRGIRCS